MPDHPIFTAVRALDVEALRRELAAGVDPDMCEDGPYAPTPLCQAVHYGCAFPATRFQERLECIAVLLEAGASVDKQCGNGETPLFKAAGVESPTWTVVIAALLEAGADPNFTRTRTTYGVVAFSYVPRAEITPVLAAAALTGSAGAVRMLLSAGAVANNRALESAIISGKQRICTLLLRAGAAIPWRVYEGTFPPDPQTLAYIRRIRATWGGFKAYEKAHRQHLAAIFLAKFPVLPVEMLERIVEFSYICGGPSKCPSMGAHAANPAPADGRPPLAAHVPCDPCRLDRPLFVLDGARRRVDHLLQDAAGRLADVRSHGYPRRPRRRRRRHNPSPTRGVAR